MVNLHCRRTGQTVKNSKATNYVEHITISYNEEDQSYGIEGEVGVWPSSNIYS